MQNNFTEGRHPATEPAVHPSSNRSNAYFDAHPDDTLEHEINLEGSPYLRELADARAELEANVHEQLLIFVGAALASSMLGLIVLLATGYGSL